MADFAFDIVGFDLDGTLLDTAADLADALNHALATVGREPLSLVQVRRMVGKGVRHLLEQGLAATGGSDPALIERALPALLDQYQAHIARHSRPFDGVVDQLEALAQRGVRLAVATNKLEHLATKLLAEIGLARHFACVIGGDTLGPGTAKPSPAGIAEMIRRCGGGRAAFVGDSIHDVMAARAAGVPVIAVSFGFRDRAVEALGADAVIDGFGELLPALKGLGSGRHPDIALKL